MTKLTNLEEKVMKAIVKDDFYEAGFDSALWVDILLDQNLNIGGKVGRGVISSLIKKDFIIATGDGAIYLEEKGKAWLLEQGLVNEEGFEIRS